MGQRRKGKRPLDQTPLIRLCASPRQPLVGTHESRMRRETEERHVEYGRDHREIRCKLVSHMPGKQKSLMMRRISQPSNPTHPPNNPFRCAQWAKHLCHGVSHLYKTTADTHHTRALIPPPCLSLLHTHTHTHTHIFPPTRRVVGSRGARRRAMPDGDLLGWRAAPRAEGQGGRVLLRE